MSSAAQHQLSGSVTMIKTIWPDALCHSIKQNVLQVSRHVKDVTGKVNLTLNAPAAVILLRCVLQPTNQMP